MDVIAKNKVVNKFMGYAPDYNNDSYIYQYFPMGSREDGIWGHQIVMAKAALKYNLSWDWLMPVIDKIQDELGFNITISRSFAQIQVTSDSKCFFEMAISHSGRPRKISKIEATFEVVVGFIQWYNENKK